MKKLALALVCMFSVAFFASCTQDITNPEPSISVITDEGFVKNGDVIDLEQPFVYGFQMASNSQTKKELKQLSVVATILDLDGNEAANQEEIVPLIGLTEYRYVVSIYYELDRDVIGSVRYVATVTDVDGKINAATLTISLNRPTQPLEEKDFTWFRHGSNDGEGLAEYGLEWKGNGKEVFAIIKPVAGATMFMLSPENWDAITTDIEKAAFFSEGNLIAQIPDFRGVSAWNTKDYDYVIATLYNDEYHVIHITHGQVDNNGSAGTDITITGKAK